MLSSLILALAPQIAVAPQPLLVQGDYGAQPSVDTVFDVIYPPGKGPSSLGHAPEQLPVMISLRGGNNNTVVPGAPAIGSISVQAVTYGIVGVEPNFPTVGQGQDYSVSSDAVARLVQYLRANAQEYNIDPGKVFLLGRSFGQIVCLAVALKDDHQDLASSDPVEWESSRPDYVVARQGPTALHCFSSNTTGWHSSMSLFFFPASDFKSSTLEQKISESSVWWLTNPHLFGRVSTPPMCLVYKYAHGDTCGSVKDVHSGLFGDILTEATEDLARATGDADFLARRGRIDNGAQNETVTITRILLWAAQRLADDFGGLLLVPPLGTLDTVAGGTIKLNVLGATPGSTVSFYRGTVPGGGRVTGCPGLQEQIGNAVLLGQGVADSAGLASISFFVPPGQAGSAVLFHALAAGTCESSNLVLHTYVAAVATE